MTIKEHIAFAKQVLNRIRNEDPEAINPILEEMAQWKRIDVAVEAGRQVTKMLDISTDPNQPEMTQCWSEAREAVQRSKAALIALESHHDIEPAQVKVTNPVIAQKSSSQRALQIDKNRMA